MRHFGREVAGRDSGGNGSNDTVYEGLMVSIGRSSKTISNFQSKHNGKLTQLKYISFSFHYINLKSNQKIKKKHYTYGIWY